MITNMKQVKEKAVYCAGMAVLLLLLYGIGSYCLYGKVYSLFGNGNRHVWEISDLAEAGQGFQLQEDGTFLAAAPDAHFLIQESFGIRTVLIETGKMNGNYEGQILCFSGDEPDSEDFSEYMEIHRGVNYIQLPDRQFHSFRISFAQEGDTGLAVRRITAYGSRVIPSWFLIAAVAVWAVLGKIIYKLVFQKKKAGEKTGQESQAADKAAGTVSSPVPDRMHSVSYLRVIALGMILYDHLGAMRSSGWFVKRAVDFVLCTPLHIIQDFGALGVSLFYLITGFLFIHSAKRKDKCFLSSLRKIVKLYLFTMLSFVFFGVFQWGLNQVSPTYWAQFSIKDWAGCATLINHFNGIGENVNGTTWFLIPLFCFYLSASVSYQAAGKDVFKTLTFLEGFSVILTVLGIVGSRITGAAYASTLLPFIYIPIMGMIIYACISGEMPYIRGMGMGVLNYIMMTLSFYRLNGGYYADAPYIISFVYAVLLLLVFVAGEKFFKENKAVELLGKISLSVYLVHMTWGGLFMSLLEPKIGFSPAFVCSLILVLAVSWLHYVLIEKRLLKAI